MIERVFLGWEKPFSPQVADWLLNHREELPQWWVITPTSQSGRSLRSQMARQAEALLAPVMRTPGSFLKTPDPGVAPDWIERLAWMETLENIGDWSRFEDLFPEAPGSAGGPWSSGLARQLLGLRHKLQENGLTLSSAARILSNSIEAERWTALATLEALMEANLYQWGYQSRSRVLAAGLTIPAEVEHIILAGITEMPALLESALRQWPGRVSVLIPAPESEQNSFTDLGKPLNDWSDRILPWPEGGQGSVTLCADSRQEATEALRKVAEHQTHATDLALGTANAENGDDLAREFTLAGWPAFHPASPSISTGAARWFAQWAEWLASPSIRLMADLLNLPETAMLTGASGFTLASGLSKLRSDWVLIRPDDLRQRMKTTDFRSAGSRLRAQEVCAAMERLMDWRERFLHDGCTRASFLLLDAFEQDPDADVSTLQSMRRWLESAAEPIQRLNRPPEFWLKLMLEEIPPPAPHIPEGRVINVQGWLELLFEPGNHLVLCGMNDGKVPAVDAGDPWLGESAASLLGLPGNASRAARDAFLYQSMLESRRSGGRTDLFCAKAGSGGDTLMPSRLLLAAEPAALPSRVKWLFQELQPPEAGMSWHADWKWNPGSAEIPNSLSVTSLAAYLACPFRFYLRHGLGMNQPSPGRVEWNARDFGNIAHEILENWGRDPEARDLSKTEALHAWFLADLERILLNHFGGKPPLAVRIQAEAMRQRLLWLARCQACSRAEGWEVAEIEQPFEITFGSTTIKGRIDRIDRHRESGQLRVLDYKTGKSKSPESAHRRKITARTNLPEHITSDSPACHAAIDKKGKPANYRWINLQLPLYVLATNQRCGQSPLPCYFQLGSTETEVKIEAWEDFNEGDLQAAELCAQWITEQITAGRFWPPAEKPEFDDFSILTMGRSPIECFTEPAAKG